MDETDLLALSLNPADIARVAEFFECDVDAAFEFVRKVWLPDARQTAERIVHAVRTHDWASLLFLCDHLREGARSVGATRIMQYAGDIELCARNRTLSSVNRHVRKLGIALETLGTLLGDPPACASAGVC